MGITWGRSQEKGRVEQDECVRLGTDGQVFVQLPHSGDHCGAGCQVSSRRSSACDNPVRIDTELARVFPNPSDC